MSKAKETLSALQPLNGHRLAMLFHVTLTLTSHTLAVELLESAAAAKSPQSLCQMLIRILTRTHLFLNHCTQLFRADQYFCTGLQTFVPEKGKYDLIWIQWVIGYLTDGKALPLLLFCFSESHFIIHILIPI